MLPPSGQNTVLFLLLLVIIVAAVMAEVEHFIDKETVA